MPDRLLVDLAGNGQAGVLSWPDGGLPEEVSRGALAWPLDGDALEDLRWYLEDYLLAPFGVWEERGPAVREKLAGWGEQVFGSVFGSGPARFAYERARDRRLEVVFRSAEPGLLGLPWELMRDAAGPVALGAGGISRSLPVTGSAGTLQVRGGRLRVLMVICRPGGTGDVGYQMVARPLLERLEAVRGEVELMVLRPPTFDALGRAVREAADGEVPFHIVHFDGHGAVLSRAGGSGAVPGSRPAMMAGPGEGVLAFEQPGGGSDLIGASKVAAVLAEGRVPVTVLNACQSGAVGKELEASVATALLNAGCAAVVAMAYSVYAVAAAEFMAAFYESGVASFGLDGVITGIGLDVFGADFARLDPAERLAAVKRLLGQYRVLLVWDNFESVTEMPDPDGATPPLDEAGCAQLREFVDWVRDHSKSTILITSRARETWLGQVRRVEVGGLNRAEAAEYSGYLLEPFSAARQRRERRSFGELLDWLDGHPLAMRLILPRLEAADPVELLAGLQGTTPLPGGDDAGPGRLSSLGASITYSFAHLTEWTRRLLPAVSLFHGVVDETLLTLMSAAETLPTRFADISRQKWTAALQDAERVGLLTGLGGSMYRIHPALPGYLAAGWHAETPDGYGQERDACEQALCTACARLSAWLFGQIQAGDAALAYAVIGLLRRTLGAMLGHALDHNAWAEADHIIRALDAYWDTRGLSVEAATWADRILDATAGAGRSPAATAGSLWMYTLSQQAERQQVGQPDEAAQSYRQVLAWLQCQPETEWTRVSIAVTYHRLGITAYLRGRLDEAEDWYRQSLAIKEELGDRPGMATTYHQLGMAAERWGRLDEAEDWYRQSLAIEEELGDRPGMADTHHQLGNIAYLRERLDEAEDWYRQSLAIEEELGDRPGMAAAYHQLGMIAQDRGHRDEAEDWYRQSLAIKEELGNRVGMATTYHQLGNMAYLRRRLDEAEDWYRQSLAIREEFGNRVGMATSYHQLGMIAQKREDYEEATRLYQRSLAINEEFGDRVNMALTYEQLGLLAEEEAQASQALVWNIRCVTLFSDFPNSLSGTGPSALARLTQLLGMSALEQAWEQVTGQPLPREVRDWVTSQPAQPNPE